MTELLSPLVRIRRELRVLRAHAHLRRHGVTIGARPSIEGWAPVIQNEGSISLGDRASLHGFESRSLLRTVQGANLSVGHRAYLNSGLTITAIEDITIGDDVKIAGNVGITSTGGHEIVAGHGIKDAPVTIGNNVWIGRGAFILPGVSIGDNAIIGASAVVTRDVPGDSIAAGAPAKVIRQIPSSTVPRR